MFEYFKYFLNNIYFLIFLKTFLFVLYACKASLIYLKQCIPTLKLRQHVRWQIALFNLRSYRYGINVQKRMKPLEINKRQVSSTAEVMAVDTCKLFVTIFGFGLFQFAVRLRVVGSRCTGNLEEGEKMERIQIHLLSYRCERWGTPHYVYRFLVEKIWMNSCYRCFSQLIDIQKQLFLYKYRWKQSRILISVVSREFYADCCSGLIMKKQILG